MIEYIIYCNIKPSPSEVRSGMSAFGFEDVGNTEWPLRMNSSPESRPIFIAGRRTISLFYTPQFTYRRDIGPPVDTARSTFYLSTDSNAVLEDALFLGITAGFLGTKYNGVLYDPISKLLSPPFDERVRPETKQISIPDAVWQGLEAVRLSGLTNMLDRNAVQHIASKMGFKEASDWIGQHKKEYAEGIFKGFAVLNEDD